MSPKEVLSLDILHPPADKTALAYPAVDVNISLPSIGGCNFPCEDDDYDFGSGAGFYLNATQEPWSKNYHMYDYITKEVIA